MANFDISTAMICLNQLSEFSSHIFYNSMAVSVYILANTAFSIFEIVIFFE